MAAVHEKKRLSCAACSTPSNHRAERWLVVLNIIKILVPSIATSSSNSLIDLHNENIYYDGPKSFCF
jgi:hypothetical protein